MEAKDKRKVKQINGWKVNHPFQGGNIFYSFLTLLLVGVPFVYVFMPIVTTNPSHGFQPYFFGSDILLGFFKNFFQEPPANIAAVYDQGGSMLQQAEMYLLIAQAAIILLSMLIGVVAFIIFLVSCCRGYLRHAKLVRALTAWSFVFSLLFSISYAVVYIFIFIAVFAFPALFIWWNFVLTGGLLILLIVVSIAYSNNYKDVIFEADLEYHSDGEKEVVTHVTEVHNVTKPIYTPANSLPPNLKSIGGHAFSQNQYLEIANVPVGITSLGGGAFANCLKLQVVSLPSDIKEIGYNCFFNCVSLERINFAGTKEQWRHIRRGSNWLAKARTTKVVCIDGAIVVNPYH